MKKITLGAFVRGIPETYSSSVGDIVHANIDQVEKPLNISPLKMESLQKLKGSVKPKLENINPEHSWLTPEAN